MLVGGSSCSLIATEARAPCTELVDELSELECNAARCCWDGNSDNIQLKCYQKGISMNNVIRNWFTYICCCNYLCAFF